MPEGPVHRLAPLFATLCLGLSPLHASAVSALFDFDDFPGGVSPSDPLWNAPYTYLYRCDGKDYCTGREALNASSGGDPAPGRIATTRNGIAMEFSRAGYTINYDGAGFLDDGDDSADSFELFLFDFDTPLQSFAGRISAPSVISETCDENDVCTDVYSIVELFLWSDPGGQGTLVGSLALTHDDVLGSGSAAVLLATDQPFRSASFGHSVSGDPDSWTWGPYNSFGIDYVLVSTVPEPSTAALLLQGLTAMAAARRRRIM